MPRARRPTPRKRDPARARESILDAAHRRFSTHGYRGTRVADVAKDAGCSEALVYFHFRTKSELFREVVNRIQADTTWFPEQPTAETTVQAMHDGELRYHRDARWRALDRVWAEALGGEADLLDLMRPQLREAVARLDGLLSQFGDHPQRLLFAKLILSVSYGSRVVRRYDPDVLAPEEAADLLAFATSTVLAAIAAGPQQPAPSSTPDPG